jgi:hypothetical protein
MTPPRLHRVIEKKSTKDKIMSFLNTRICIVTTRIDVIIFVFLMILFLLLCSIIQGPTYGWL